MTRDQQIADIRQKCIEANGPAILGRRMELQLNPKQFTPNVRVTDYPIRLADVLLALETKDPSRTTVGHFKQHCGDICNKWNLRTDDLTQQADETVEFIHSLLCV